MRCFCNLVLSFVATLALIIASAASAEASGVTVTPTSWDFGPETVGLKSKTVDIQVTNGSARAITVASFSMSDPQFQITQGVAPVKVFKGTVTHYTVQFAPASPGPQSAVFSIFIQGLTNPLKVDFSGIGTTTTAVATLSTQAIDFGSVDIGQTSGAQQVKLTNTGSQALTLDSATVDAPFSTSKFDLVTLSPGQSLAFDVFFSPGRTGSFINTLVLTYTTLPAQGINLSGLGTAPASVGVANFPTLPAATRNAAYYVALGGAGGTPPYSWNLQAGSSLPAGLVLSSTGEISGTVTASKATYKFTVEMADAAVPPLVATRELSLDVDAPKASNCNNISFDVPGTGTPILGLDVLGTGTYLGSQGGLYPNGSNVRPARHNAFGESLAQSIQPLDSDGNFDPNGKEVVVVLGESNVHIEGESIVRDATADPSRNPSVMVVNGALGGATARLMSDPTSAYWSTILNYILPNYGVTAKQVVAAWVEPTDGLSTGTFPSDMDNLKSEVRSEAQALLTNFPNIKLAYISSRVYSGYSNGVNTINPEPYAFESSFAVKWVIQAQIAGDAALNYDPGRGPVKAPWLSWGPYTWADGLVVPSSNGKVWSCQDITDDGTHPDHVTGAEEIANQVLNFFKTDSTTAPWFLAH